MKKLFKKLALAVVALLTFSVGSNYTVKEVKAASGSYVKVTEVPTDWSGNYLIVYEAGNVAFNGGLTTLDAVSNTIKVTISNNEIEATEETNNATFTINASGHIKSASGYYIGQTSNANGLQSSTSTTYTNTITFNNDGTVNFVSGGAYLRYNATSGQTRFRYYKSSSYTGQKAISLYKYIESIELDENIKTALNNVESYMSLSYKYESKKETINTITDTLTRELTGIEGTTYKDWSDKTSTSGVVYAGQSAGGNNSIQLRSTNSNSGIITTNSERNAKKITVSWESNTTSGRTLDVYGKTSAYTSASDLYDSSTQGTKIGSIVCGTSTELEITGNYMYIGLRSKSGAMYLSEIKIEWECESTTKTTIQDSQFYIRCGADKSLSEIDSVDSYGIRVSAGDNVVEYRPDTADSWGVDSTYNYCYVVINLGNVFDNEEKLTTEFTVCAFVEVNDTIYTSEKTKTYSVVSMVQYYYESEESTEEVKSQVEHLYNYFVENGYIA